ncbi:MAG: HAMP domain-containing histidine kinase [bacterium]|nr:HAMP domain-containing histidine kinase [bacterium]
MDHKTSTDFTLLADRSYMDAPKDKRAMPEPGLLQSTATKLAGLAAGFFAVSHFAKAAIAGEPVQAVNGVGPAIAAVLALFMIWKRWYRADIVLIVAVVASTALFKFSVEETSDPTLVAVALVVTAGALLMPESWKWPYVWLGGLLLLTMTAYWNGISTETAWTGMSAALTGVSMMILLLKLRDGLAASNRRYQVLVERLPVPLIEQDWSRLRSWLDDRRREGVTDIGAYLDSHPEELIDAMRHIRVRGVNPAITSLVGHGGVKQGIDQDAAYGITVESMAPYVRQEIIGIWEGTGPLADDYLVARSNGTELWTRLEAAEIEEGSIPGVDRVIVATDVTELKETQAELGEQLRSKDEFIAAVSHELRTPLTSVLGFAELMQQDVERLTTGQHDMLGQIASQAGEMAHIVEDLLVAARAEIGSIIIKPEAFALTPAVEQAVADVDSDFPIHTNGELIVRGDRVRTIQIIRNLATNAHRYGGDQRSAHVGHDGGYAVVEVRDNGAGIPQEEHERVFEPYTRAHDRPGMTASVGLGLTVSRQLAELMEGTVDYSRESGLSVFRLKVPLAEMSSSS